MPDFFGDASLRAISFDLGHTGRGTPQTDSDTLLINVLPVNDAPVFDALRDIELPEDTVPVGIEISGVSPGPANELDQVVSLTASTDNPLLITELAIEGSGTASTLRLTPAPNASGAAVITLRAIDDGGTAQGGVDTFERIFRVTVTPVNDAPLAVDDQYATDEDTTLGISAPGVLSHDSDIEQLMSLSSDDNWLAFEAEFDALMTAEVEGEGADVLIELYTSNMLPVMLSRGSSSLTVPINEHQQYVLHIGTSRPEVSATIRLTNLGSTGAFHNAEIALDVSGDGYISPLDALLIVNDLNRSGARALFGQNETGYFTDASGDGAISARDALLVVNFLNGGGDVEGEGEKDSAPTIASRGVLRAPSLLPVQPRIEATGTSHDSVPIPLNVEANWREDVLSAPDVREESARSSRHDTAWIFSQQLDELLDAIHLKLGSDLDTLLNLVADGR